MISSRIISYRYQLWEFQKLENYLDENGKPIVIFRRGRNSGKTTKRYLSRRRFEKALGVASTENSSGNRKDNWRFGSLSYCFMAMDIYSLRLLFKELVKEKA